MIKMYYYISLVSLSIVTILLVLCHCDLVIQPQETEIIKPLGSSILLTCSSHTATNLKWMDRNGIVVNETDGSSRLAVELVDQWTLKLHILNLISHDAGIYFCVGNSSGHLKERSIRLRVFKDITFDNAPPTQHLVINTSSIVSCVVSGDPRPTVEWKFNEKRIQYGSKYEKTNEGLLVKNVSASDKGVYLCIAEVGSLGKFDRRNISVEVYAPPKITSWLAREEAMIDQSVTFVCDAQGFPRPIFNFYKETIDIHNTTSFVMINPENSPNIIIENNEMKITSLSKRDQTNYKCKVHNDAGGDYSEATYLKILVPARITHFSSSRIRSNDNITIDCITEGDPDNDAYIYFNGVLKWHYTISNRFDGIRTRYSIPRKNVFSLTITGTKPEDAGLYSCIVDNGVGKDVKNATLIIEHAPYIIQPETSNEAYVWPDVARNITCYFKSEPKPTVMWKQHKSGDVIKNNASFGIFVGDNYTSLQVSVREKDQAWIYESYECLLSNTFGNDSFVVHLKRATIPDSPLVRISRTQPTDIWLLVQPSEETGGVPINGYIVQNQDKTSEYGLENELRVSNLQPNTVYLLTVKSRNEVGIGAPTHIRVQTLGINTPHIQLFSKRDQQIHARSRDYRVFWMVNTTGGLSIDEYEFLYKKEPQRSEPNEWNEYRFNFNDISVDMDDVNSWIQIKVKDDTHNPIHDFLITDLTPNTLYVLKMRAKNAIGWSDFTELIEFQTLEASYSEYDQKDRIPVTYYAIVILLIVVFLIVVIATVDVAFCLCCDKGLTRTIFMRCCKLTRNNSNEKQCLQMKNINGSHSKSNESSSSTANNGHNSKSKKDSHRRVKKKCIDPVQV